MGEGLFQPTHLILILAIVLVVFGPSKLTEIGASLGQGIKEFRHATRDEPQTAARQMCAACGSELPDGARFCPRCGQAVAPRPN